MKTTRNDALKTAIESVYNARQNIKNLQAQIDTDLKMIEASIKEPTKAGNFLATVIEKTRSGLDTKAIE